MSASVVRAEGSILTGKCKAWNLEKGYGFAAMDDGGADLFLHQSAVVVEDGFRSISVGTPIQLTYGVRDGKPAGSNITAVGGAPLTGYATKLEASQKMTTSPLAPARPGTTVGKVKWFDASKGYGFLTAESGAEVFVNIKDVENQIPLAKDEPVDFFTEAQTDGRQRAMRVRSLNPNQPIAQPHPMYSHPPHPHHPAGYGAYPAVPPAGYGYAPSHYSPYQMTAPVGIPMAGVSYSGVCKWFNSAKGWGFITPADGTAELYFKGTDIQGGGLLEQGEPVRYEAKHQDGKSWAVNVMSTRLTPKRPNPAVDPYSADLYGSQAAMKQPKTQYAPSPAQRYDQQQPQPFAFDQYGQQAVPKMPSYGAVPGAERAYEYQPDPAAAYQQAVQFRQY